MKETAECCSDEITDTIEKDLNALSSWLDSMIKYLTEKCPNSPTHLVQACSLKDLFSKARAEAKAVKLNPSQSRDFMLFFTLILWALQLSICATLASSRVSNSSHSEIFSDISRHLFEQFILLRDSLTVLLLDRFDSFNEVYANIKVYSNIKSFISFYRTYCLQFEDKVHKQKIDNFEKGWAKIQDFIRILGNKSGHEYDKDSKQEVNLIDFDHLLEIDYRGSPEYQIKIGDKMHKYPLAILLLFRFLLKDQGEDFSDINEKWFACDGKIIDQFGNVKQVKS